MRPTHCRRCHGELPARAGPGRPPRHCSDACRTAADAAAHRVRRRRVAGLSPSLPSQAGGGRLPLVRRAALGWARRIGATDPADLALLEELVRAGALAHETDRMRDTYRVRPPTQIRDPIVTQHLWTRWVSLVERLDPGVRAMNEMARRHRTAGRRRSRPDPWEEMSQLAPPSPRHPGGAMVDAFVTMLSGHADPAAAYRQLSKAAHPDGGGSDAMMAAVNAAWERVGGSRRS